MELQLPIKGLHFLCPEKRRGEIMIYTKKIQKAISFAINTHKKQFRKGKDVPYIIHPFSVALILSRVTKSEDIICAGLLHDTIEDCDPEGLVTKEILEKGFGPAVAEMVNDVTEQNKTLSWAERKRRQKYEVQFDLG